MTGVTNLTLTVYLIPSARIRLELIAEETGRKVEDLAASAIEETALNYFRNREDDPAKGLY